MRCFYHQDRDAVGSCKSCGKGLCPECAVDLGKGLACRTQCEAAVRTLNELIDRNVRLGPTTETMIRRAGSTRVAGTVFFLAMGALFFGWSVIEARQLTLIGMIGLGFLAYGVFHLIQTIRMAAARRRGPS